MICECVSKHVSCELVSKDVNSEFNVKDQSCDVVPKDVTYEFVFEMQLVFLQMQAVRVVDLFLKMQVGSCLDILAVCCAIFLADSESFDSWTVGTRSNASEQF